MNCLEFRRIVLVRPLHPGGEAHQHSQECAACREFLARQCELDADIYLAMNVPVPDGLADRILVAQGLRNKRRLWPWAIAATVALVAGLILVLSSYDRGDELGREVIAHVAAEPKSFELVSKHAAGLLPTALGLQGVRALSPLGEVTYSSLCPLAGQLARHVVVATSDGAITMFLMPDDPEKRRRALTEVNGMTAITVPAPRGSIAIVASNRSQALAIERALVSA
jgi:hypothetical protein